MAALGSQVLQPTSLNLADAFARDAKVRAHFLQCLAPSAFQPEAAAHHRRVLRFDSFEEEREQRVQLARKYSHF